MRLDLKAQMLFRGREVYTNGVRCTAGRAAAPLLTKFADQHRLAPPLTLRAEAARSLYQRYRAGYIDLNP